VATSVWKGHLTFGLVSLPVRLFSAARAESVSFNLLHKSDNSRIKQVTYCQAEDKPVPRSDLVKGYEYEKGHYVVIEDDDIKKVAPKTAKVMEILEFVETKDIDPVYLESSYYMAPEAGGEKAYALLFSALQKSGYSGVAKIAMHNREHIVILRPGAKGILLHTMYFTNEVRQVDEFRTDLDLVKEKEMALAQHLIEALAAKFEPEKYSDTYRDNLMKMIETKISGQKVVEAPEPHIAPVIDIMEALKRTLEIRKKPVQAASEAESEGAASTKRRRAGGSKSSS